MASVNVYKPKDKPFFSIVFPTEKYEKRLHKIVSVICIGLFGRFHRIGMNNGRLSKKEVLFIRSFHSTWGSQARVQVCINIKTSKYATTESEHRYQK